MVSIEVGKYEYKNSGIHLKIIFEFSVPFKSILQYNNLVSGTISCCEHCLLIM
jgi:hypothetical protein